MSNIEWTDATWNPVVGCTPVSSGCLNCYAATMARRLEAMGRPEYATRPCGQCGGTGAIERDGVDRGCPGCKQTRTVRIAEVRDGRAVFTGEVRCLPERLKVPLHWRKPRRVFVNSMSDLFHEAVPFEFVDRVFAVMALCPRHTFQVLTKRPERMAEYFDSFVDEGGCANDAKHDQLAELMSKLRPEWATYRWPLPNVWLGTSVENQAAADERIPHLLKCPAAVRFLSVEPLLGPVNLWRYLNGYVGGDVTDESGCANGVTMGARVAWVIVGGESGPHARACNVAWIRSIVAQCKAAGVPCFVKQLGANPQGDPPEPPVYNPLTKATTYTVQEVIEIANRKGGDPAEWPADLRVRQMPGGAA